MSAARAIARMAVGAPGDRPGVRNLYGSEDDAAGRSPQRGAAVGLGGGLSVKHHFPLDGTYAIKIRLQRHYTTTSAASASRTSWTCGSMARWSRGFRRRRPERGPAGACHLRRQHSGFPRMGRLHARRRREPGDAPGGLTAGTRTIGVSSRPGALRKRRHPFSRAMTQRLHRFRRPAGYRISAVDRLEVRGPTSAAPPGRTPSRRRVFVCPPDPRRTVMACASAAFIIHPGSPCLSSSGHRGRCSRAAGPFYLNRPPQSAASMTGMSCALARDARRVPIPVPGRTGSGRRAPPDAPYRVRDLELASRLSFFLWSSIPDDELLDARRSGKTGESGRPRAAGRRMLADPRATGAGRQLRRPVADLRNLRGVVARSANSFPTSTRTCARRCSRRRSCSSTAVCATIAASCDLLTADYTFVNERLARHYGIPSLRQPFPPRDVRRDRRARGAARQGSS